MVFLALKSRRTLIQLSIKEFAEVCNFYFTNQAYDVNDECNEFNFDF